EIGLHIGDWARRSFGTDRRCSLEAGAVFLAGVADGWLPLRAHMAFRGHLGRFVFHIGPSGYGGIARLEQLRVDVDRLEQSSRLYPPVIGDGTRRMAWEGKSSAVKA